MPASTLPWQVAMLAFGRVFGRGASYPTPPAAGPVAAARPSELDKTMSSLGVHASTIGREAAEVRGLLDDTAQASARSAQAVDALAVEVRSVTAAQDAIRDVSNASLGAVERARGAVADVSNGVEGIVHTLRSVSSAADGITRIAVQTRLVAFNAAVEAKHAGDAGRGFSVVAEAVKDLAAQVESTSKEITRTVSDLQVRILALAQDIRAQPEGEPVGGFHLALAELQESVSHVTATTATSRAICANLNEQMAQIGCEMQRTGRALDAVMVRSEAFLTVSETLIEQIAESGIETEDTPYIQAAIQAAQQISALLTAAVERGEISMADLFDDTYVPIPGTQPQQVLTRFVDLADRLFPSVQEPVLQLSQKVVFCIAGDRNGYIPRHNATYSVPQRGDLAWDTAHSRYRRIFTDRTSLASVRNTRPFLLQTYRRDMGMGQFVVMKEAAAPIVVQGRHWGGIRLAFKF